MRGSNRPTVVKTEGSPSQRSNFDNDGLFGWTPDLGVR